MGELTVHYERKFSDGNFGSEGLSMSVTYDVDELTTELAIDHADWLRRFVLSFLANSAAERVRWAANHELKARDPKPVDGEAVAVTDIEDLPF